MHPGMQRRIPLDEGPFLRRPSPTHDAPSHCGWKAWCRLCVSLHDFVDGRTGGATPWTAQERSLSRGPYRKASVEIT